MTTGEDIFMGKSLLLPGKYHHPFLLTTLTKAELRTPAQHSHSSLTLFYLPNSMYYACLLFNKTTRTRGLLFFFFCFLHFYIIKTYNKKEQEHK